MAPEILPASIKHTATLIFLHGLGDTGSGWIGGMERIRAPYMKVICPTAPKMPVTLNSGFEMPSWFDLKSLDASGPEDEDGIKKASKSIHSIIEQEETIGIPSNRVIIGGFSQGGALALYTALTYPKKLACVVGLSCWLPLHKTFPAAAKVNKDTPFLLCHGDCDPIVPYKWGQLSSSVMKQFASSVEFRTYRGLLHSSSEEEMEDMKTFICSNVKSQQ